MGLSIPLRLMAPQRMELHLQDIPTTRLARTLVKSEILNPTFRRKRRRAKTPKETTPDYHDDLRSSSTQHAMGGPFFPRPQRCYDAPTTGPPNTDYRRAAAIVCRDVSAGAVHSCRVWS